MENENKNQVKVLLPVPFLFLRILPNGVKCSISRSRGGFQQFSHAVKEGSKITLFFLRCVFFNKWYTKNPLRTQCSDRPPLRLCFFQTIIFPAKLFNRRTQTKIDAKVGRVILCPHYPLVLVPKSFCIHSFMSGFPLWKEHAASLPGDTRM